MNFIKTLLKRILPANWLYQYHKTLVKYAAWRYRYPSNKLIVIGVTGTKGKSTASNLIWHVLTKAGYNVGLATTVNFKIGNNTWLNDTKMTMLGRTQLQKLLADMVKAGCTHAVIETSSEGIKQFRHLGITYDCVVFTNLFPEHLDAHGGFENYKQAKLDLFRYLATCPVKTINHKPILKGAVINGDSEYATEFFQAANVPNKIVWAEHELENLSVTLPVSDVQEQPNGLLFTVGSYELFSNLLGRWNIENVLSALGVGTYCGLSLPAMADSLTNFHGVPGRMELIEAGQNFTVIVDYAYEPRSLTLLYEFWRKRISKDKKIITLISSTGGGRDKSRRLENGQVAGKLCDYVIVTDEDPYDDDPLTIINEVAAGVQQGGKIENETFWKIQNRYKAIKQACSLAQAGDVVILPCKGAEQKMCLAKGKKIDWDDREVVKDILNQ
ncbi:MAG: UDP-N-acetylmuramoyl-L-alanyl-D-glutamate--2,6-diaminopimelate ligase [Patescibacteria group bacterium]|jgi:UDP-N-acetylmuramoyl-L-alanyl-D-glutamate--2,6-diaminopimelate ligase